MFKITRLAKVIAVVVPVLFSVSTQAQHEFRMRLDNFGAGGFAVSGSDSLNIGSSGQEGKTSQFQLSLSYWKPFGNTGDNYLIFRGGLNRRDVEASYTITESGTTQVADIQESQDGFQLGFGVGKKYSFDKIVFSVSTDLTYRHYNELVYEEDIVQSTNASSIRLRYMEERPSTHVFLLNADIGFEYVFFNYLALGVGINTGLIHSRQVGEYKATQQVFFFGTNPKNTFDGDYEDTFTEFSSPNAFVSLGLYFN